MAINPYQVDDEKKKKKLNLLPTTDSAFTGEAWNVSNLPKKKQAPMTQGNPDSESFYGGSNPQRKLERIQSTLGEPKTLNLYEPTVSSSVPRINEVPNIQRDTELGKINVSTNGDTTTYNIGESTASYKLNPNDQKIKSNLEKINQIISSGAAISPVQMARINKIRQDAGYLRGGTDRNIIGSDGIPLQQQASGIDVQFDSSVSPEARARFLENPVRPTAQIDRFEANQNVPLSQYPNINVTPTRSLKDMSLGEVFVEGLQGKRNRSDAQIANMEAEQNINRGNLLTAAERNQIERDKLALDEETSRINKMDVESQSKLREIQGQVAQQPPVRESALKPMVVKEYDELGNVIGERIKIPNADGTGYVDGMNEQSTFVTPKPATIQKMMKMRDSNDPNLAAAEEEYKKRFGSLPY